MSEDLTWQPAWRLAELIAKKEVSAIEVTEHFLARVEELNPKVHAFATVDHAGAQRQAKHADHAVRTGKDLAPLHGIPIAVVENFVKVKGLPAKSFGIADCRFDHIGVERLRRAGAIIFGLTATYFATPETRPRNPWNLRMDPGNSSRGSAAAASSALVPVTIGADGAGSTRLPAAFSGVVGVHPSRGLVPHVDYDKPSLLTYMSIGPMGRDVRDCAIALQAMAGPDPRDLVCIENDPPELLARIDQGVEGLRLAWTDDFGWSGVHAVEETPRVTALARDAAMGLASLGAVVEPTDEVWEDPLMSFGTLNAVFASIGYPPANLAGRIFEREREFDMEAGLPLRPERASELPAFSAKDYQAAVESRARNWASCRRVFAEHDVLLCPTTLMVTRPVEEWGNTGREWCMTTYTAHTMMFNLLGFPAVTVPCGLLGGLPVGLQIIAAPGREDYIFRVANAFQKAFPLNEKPPLT